MNESPSGFCVVAESRLLCLLKPQGILNAEDLFPYLIHDLATLLFGKFGI
jgi:hypothetical protein